MRKRTLKPSPDERATFGLIAWLEQTKIALPLKGVECAFHVCGDVVSVETDQIFQQNSAQPLDCLYTFPLPASAAVYRCEMRVNGRVIRAKVEERERARELAAEKKAAGHRTALVEMERDNLFTLCLGNVQPGDVVIVRFAYFQTLSRLGDWSSFNIPFCPGIRYIPGAPLLRAPKGRGAVDDTDQVPDASRISPPRMDRLHPDAAYLSVEGTVEHPLGDVKDISSPSHPVLVKPGKSSSRVSIADRAAMPDSDFIMRWTEAQPVEVNPMGWVAHTRRGTFALIRFRAPQQVEASDAYAQDLYFLIDRSGSMAGLKWQKAVEAFRQFLKTLGPDDRVWATFFESQSRDLAEKPLAAADILSDPAVKTLETLGTTGGTELLPALEHVLGKIAAHSTDRPASLVLITDGQVGNERPILHRLARHTNLRMHVFGIDVAINDGFLQKLAAQHHGSSCLLSPTDDIVGAVARLGDRLRRPVLTSIRVQGGWELAGQELPDLHAGEILSLPLKAEQCVSPLSNNSLTLEGKLPEGTTKTYHFDLVETSAIGLPLLWAKRRTEFLLAKGQSKDAIAMAKEHNLVCEGAAFVAWDEAEKVLVSSPDREVYQPAFNPADMRTTLFAARAVGAGKLSFRGGAAGMTLGESSSSGPAQMMGAAAQIDDLLTLQDQHPLIRLRDSILPERDLARDFAQWQRVLYKWLNRRSQRPDHSRDSAQWRREIGKDVLFQLAPGAQLLDCLVGWAQSHPARTEARLDKLSLLLALLQQKSGQPPAERLDVLRNWIEREMEGKLKAQALEQLGLLEAEIRVQPTG